VLDLSLLLGAAVFASGLLAGRFWPARHRHPKPPKPVKPVCGCTHHYSFHDPKTGQCSATVQGNVIHWDADWNTPDDWEMVPCACRKYVGPEPLPTLYAPEIGG
jgi:hypothetical protein